MQSPLTTNNKTNKKLIDLSMKKNKCISKEWKKPILQAKKNNKSAENNSFMKLTKDKNNQTEN